MKERLTYIAVDLSLFSVCNHHFPIFFPFSSLVYIYWCALNKQSGEIIQESLIRISLWTEVSFMHRPLSNLLNSLLLFFSRRIFGWRGWNGMPRWKSCADGRMPCARPQTRYHSQTDARKRSGPETHADWKFYPLNFNLVDFFGSFLR